jgi:hypothetical protein
MNLDSSAFLEVSRRYLMRWKAEIDTILEAQNSTPDRTASRFRTELECAIPPEQRV